MQSANDLIYDHVDYNWRNLDAPGFVNTNYRNRLNLRDY